jgi:hypothetical protein
MHMSFVKIGFCLIQTLICLSRHFVISIFLDGPDDFEITRVDCTCKYLFQYIITHITCDKIHNSSMNIFRIIPHILNLDYFYYRNSFVFVPILLSKGCTLNLKFKFYNNSRTRFITLASIFFKLSTSETKKNPYLFCISFFVSRCLLNFY